MNSTHLCNLSKRCLKVFIVSNVLQVFKRRFTHAQVISGVLAAVFADTIKKTLKEKSDSAKTSVVLLTFVFVLNTDVVETPSAQTDTVHAFMLL